MSALSTKLTKVAAYRQPLCSLEPEAARYLQRKLAGEDEPVVRAALEAKIAMVAAAEQIIAGCSQCRGAAGPLMLLSGTDAFMIGPLPSIRWHIWGSNDH